MMDRKYDIKVIDSEPSPISGYLLFLLMIPCLLLLPACGDELNGFYDVEDTDQLTLNNGENSGENGDDGQGDGNDSTGNNKVPKAITNNYTQNSAHNRVDILWVIDNSGSMSDSWSILSQKASSFVKQFNDRRDLDYQMAVTDTNRILTQGNLKSDYSGRRVISGTQNDPANSFKQMISRLDPNDLWTFWEQGLHSLYLAISDYGNEFMRADTPLVVIVVTDEDDQSCERSPYSRGCNEYNAYISRNYTKYPTSYYADYLKNLGKSGNEVSFYPIASQEGLSCSSETIQNGDRYKKTLAQFGGKGRSLSLCTSGFEKSLETVASDISTTGVCFALEHPPIDDVVSVQVNGVVVAQSATGFHYEKAKNQVCFNAQELPAQGSQIRIDYRALLDP